MSDRMTSDCLDIDNGATNGQRVLMIYTGGTLGMRIDPDRNALMPFDFSQILKEVPEIKKLDMNISVISLEPLIDSANMNSTIWVEIAEIIEKHYEEFSGFVILHGTDTMAYSASALSFLLENLGKPVVFTGAQLPIGSIRNDARVNLMTALQIATATVDGVPSVPEVSICFNSLLLRGNRSKKVESQQFDAFKSENLRPLAEIGVHIDFDHRLIRKQTGELKVYKALEEEVVIIKLFPGIKEKYVSQLLATPGLRGVVLETFGAGNVMDDSWLKRVLTAAIEKNIILLNVSQCDSGHVIHGMYASGQYLEEIGVVSGSDMTLEAAITKLQFALANVDEPDRVAFLKSSARGELSAAL